MRVATFKKLFIQPKSLILIFIVTAVIVISSVWVELVQSKKEMIELMERQGDALLETILTSSESALYSYEKIENEIRQRLLSNAFFVREMYNNGTVNNKFLKRIAEQNGIYRINIFDKYGNKKFSSSSDDHTGLTVMMNPTDFLLPIFEGKSDTLIIGIKPARYFDGKRFTVAVAGKNRSAIVLNVDAEELLSFRKQVGFGILLRQLTENPQIEYAALQNENGIIAGSGKLKGLEPFDSLNIISECLEENAAKWRIANFDSLDVFEVFQPFIYREEIVGVFRLGISLAPLMSINERVTRRVLFLGIVLFLFGFVTITLIFARQNFYILSKKFKAIESYSTNILKNVSDSIVVIDNGGNIITLNAAAEKLIGEKEESLIGRHFYDFLGGVDPEDLFRSLSSFKEIECKINDNYKVLLISQSQFVDENNNANVILLLKDMTEEKALEKQIERKERLAAMGELSSSVAHEIRNPLNSIGTITQQLGKDFIPTENKEEYSGLTKLVYKEVRRINEIIENFLKFTRPQPIKPESFLLSDLVEQIKKQYKNLIEKNNGKFTVINNYSGAVLWDRAQIYQVLINLLENAVDAIDENGTITIEVNERETGKVEIEIRDNGKGISRENINKIFNLYYTTKSKGNGIGLSIVQKIISDHKGLLSLNSEVGKGTRVTILIPIEYL